MDKTSRTIIIFAACVLFSRTNGESTCATKYQKFPEHSACIEKASSDATPQPFSDDEKKAIVEQHNTIRSGVVPTPINMMKMSWDDEIAMIAQKWTETCTEGHDKGIQRFIPGQLSMGQNMAFGGKTITSAIESWASEASDYTYNKKISEHGEVVGHYTQVAWAESVKIGCGRAECNGKVIYTCNYAPAGNMGDFETPYKTGDTAGSECKTNVDGLCDCEGKVCWNGKIINPTTCECDCGDQYLEPECSLKCDIDDPAYCGKDSFTKDKCQTSPFITSTCPKQCDLCPYATKDYVEKPEEGGDDEETDKGKGDDDDGGASSVQLCMALFGLSLLVACPRMF